MSIPSDRRSFVAATLSLAAGAACRQIQPEVPMTRSESLARQPVLFLGHGSPMNAIEDNRWSRAFRALADQLPRPRAILAVSAHWFGPGSWVTIAEQPRTIHDFGGFPDELFALQYPAPGAPELARRVRELAGPGTVGEGSEWGLDHGTWSVLVHLFPAADVPVVQLSLDSRLAAREHLELARRLAPLADEGVLVLGSGNLVHNLRDSFARARRGDESVPDWAMAFDRDLAAACLQHDHEFVARALESCGGESAHPTPDHYLPLVYALGAARREDDASFPVEGFDRSVSMRSVRFG